MKKIHQIQPNIKNDDYNAVSKYLKNGGWITEHNTTREFETNIAKYVNRKYSLAVPNGTIALYLALLAAGLTKGKKVAVPNLTMIATINAVIWAGAEPVIVDVNSEFCLSLTSLKKIKRLDAVIYVPLNGRTSEGLEIEKWCSEKNIVLIEDSAHALGSKYSDEKYCGSLGKISIFSFTPHKIITTGQGGMILTDNLKHFKYIDKIKTFNRRKDKLDIHEGFGLNFKFTDLQASLGNSQFDKLNYHIERKQKIYSYYKKINSNIATLGSFLSNEVPWFFDLYFQSKNIKKEVVNILTKYNIEIREVYPPLSKQNYLKSVQKTDLVKSESIYNKAIWLPSSINLTLKEVNFITEVINSYEVKN